MSAAGRLWRQAPLWRLSLAAAVTFTALAALYPTPALRLLLERAGNGLAALGLPAPSGIPAGTGAPGAEPPVIGSYPPWDSTATGTIAFGGRRLPLPAGIWHEVVAGREEHDTEFDFLVLARVENGALTGIVLADGSVIPADGPLKPHLPYGCFDARNPVTVPPAASGPHDCGFTRTIGLDHLVPRAAGRLAALSIAVPPVLVASTWSRVEGGSAEAVTLAVPLSHRATVAAQSAWMRQWRAVLREAYDGTLPQAGPRPALARDPV